MPQPPLSNWELWAAAAHVQSHHGDAAPLHVAEQIGRLAVAGDVAGIEAWREIARRMDQLREGGTIQ